jgi:hypothetical protein
MPEDIFGLNVLGKDGSVHDSCGFSMWLPISCGLNID